MLISGFDVTVTKIPHPMVGIFDISVTNPEQTKFVNRVKVPVPELSEREAFEFFQKHGKTFVIES